MSCYSADGLLDDGVEEFIDDAFHLFEAQIAVFTRDHLNQFRPDHQLPLVITRAPRAQAIRSLPVPQREDPSQRGMEPIMIQGSFKTYR